MGGVSNGNGLWISGTKLAGGASDFRNEHAAVALLGMAARESPALAASLTLESLRTARFPDQKPTERIRDGGVLPSNTREALEGELETIKGGGSNGINVHTELSVLDFSDPEQLLPEDAPRSGAIDLSFALEAGKPEGKGGHAPRLQVVLEAKLGGRVARKALANGTGNLLQPAATCSVRGALGD